MDINEIHPHEPVLELLLTAESWASDILGEDDTPKLRKDLYKLCSAYYKAGWDDCSHAAYDALNTLVKDWDY